MNIIDLIKISQNKSITNCWFNNKTLAIEYVKNGELKTNFIECSDNIKAYNMWRKIILLYKI